LRGENIEKGWGKLFQHVNIAHIDISYVNNITRVWDHIHSSIHIRCEYNYAITVKTASGTVYNNIRRAG